MLKYETRWNSTVKTAKNWYLTIRTYHNQNGLLPAVLYTVFVGYLVNIYLTMLKALKKKEVLLSIKNCMVLYRSTLYFSLPKNFMYHQYHKIETKKDVPRWI